jgi:hypothetical protein
MSETPAFRIEYDILGDDTVADVRGDWDVFAADNGAPGLTVESVLGQCLWDYVAGRDVRSVYRMLVEHVRATGSPKNLNFHCDDSEHVRLFHLEICRSDLHTIRFASTLLKLELRSKVPLFEAMVTRSDDDILTVCSVCKFVDCAGVWLPVEEALAQLNLMNNPVMPQISHGLCPNCFDVMQSALD